MSRLSAATLLVLLAGFRVYCWITRRVLVVVALLEHAGDIVACQPVIEHVRKTHSRPFIVWLCRRPYRDLVRHNPAVSAVLSVYCLTSWIIAKRYQIAPVVIDLHIKGRECRICGRPLENSKGDARVTLKNYYSFGALIHAFSQAAGIPRVEAPPTLYFPKRVERKVQALKLPSQYAIIHCKSNEEERDWPKDAWLELIRMLARNANLPLIEVGLRSIFNDGECSALNFCGKLSLIETARIIAGARLFIGIDSGPAHFANATNRPAVIILGPYRDFINHMPYTGYFAQGGAVILRAPRNIREITAGAVYNAVSSRLEETAAISQVIRSRQGAALEFPPKDCE